MAHEDATAPTRPGPAIDGERVEPDDGHQVAGAFWSSMWSELAERPRRLVAAVVATVVGMAVVVDVQQPSPSAAGQPSAPRGQPPVEPREATAAPAPPSPVVRYRALAEEAARTCPGLPPAVLFAIAQVETNLGRDKRVSRAGAVGPMQFLPETWRAYAIDGDGDGRADIRNPADAVHTAARHLCMNGGGEPERLSAAIWNYNRSQAYVARVLALAEVSPP